MSREIKLANSEQTATVDPCCFDYLNQFDWHLMADGRAARTEPCEEHPEPHLIFMDEEIFSRHVCDFENKAEDEDPACYDCGVVPGQPHKGVSFDAATGKYRACIKANGKTIQLGRFMSPLKAAVAYDKAALNYFGDFARTNGLIAA